MNEVLVILEHAGGRLNASAAKCVSCAAGIAAARIDVVVFAANPYEVAKQAAKLAGVARVLTVEHALHAEPVAAYIAPQLARLAASYTHVLGPSTTFGKDLMPRVAALLGVGQIGDVMRIESPRFPVVCRTISHWPSVNPAV